MATIEVKIPSVGESVQEAVLAEWFKQNGDMVEKDEALFVIETDKVTLEVTAEAAGILTILVQAGETVAVGTVVAKIEIGAENRARARSTQSKSGTRGTGARTIEAARAPGAQTFGGAGAQARTTCTCSGGRSIRRARSALAGRAPSGGRKAARSAQGPRQRSGRPHHQG
jgi:pyruvate/2-oxoglutarate dehydrogenase complex dihydrolipoamide acyltransferase (E2) component